MNEDERAVMVKEWEAAFDASSELRKKALDAMRSADEIEEQFAEKYSPVKVGDEILVRRSQPGGRRARKYRARVTSVNESFSRVSDDRVVPSWAVRATNDAMWDFYTRISMTKDGEYKFEFAEGKRGRG